MAKEKFDVTNCINVPFEERDKIISGLIDTLLNLHLKGLPGDSWLFSFSSYDSESDKNIIQFLKINLN